MSQKPLSNHKSNVGKLGEDIATTFLIRKGFRILDRNFKARYGELDIVAIDCDTLVFVEVKTRIGDHYGTPEEAVTPWKLREVITTAQYYVFKHPDLPQLQRVDVVGVILDHAHRIVSLMHTPNVTI